MKKLIAMGFLTTLIVLSAQAQQRGMGVSKRSDSSNSEQRVALVIGNSAYRDAPLLNPVNDARDIAQTLRGLGFQVIHKENLAQNEMKMAIRAFGERIRNGAIGLFYYAGHGIQVNGQNYLVPIGATINSEAEVEYESVDVGLVLAQMETAGNSMNIVVLDACRNNPFARSFRSNVRGLASINAPSGTLIAYATAPGSIASDGDARNGLYTQELLNNMRTPGLSIEEVFKRARIAVKDKTSGKQIPWESSSLVGDFYFIKPNNAGNSTRPDTTTVDPAKIELSYWESIKNSTDAEDFRSYLDKYPNGTFANLARNRLNSLSKSKSDTARPTVRLDPRDPISGEWETKALGYRTKDGRILTTPPSIVIANLKVNGNRVTGYATEENGLTMTIKDGYWQNNQLGFTTEDPNLKLTLRITARLEGEKLIGESQPIPPKGKKYSLPYRGEQYDMKDLVIIWEGRKIK
jgi:hypothetical protein